MRQCVILVGGKGTRLGKLTKNLPKPMIEISGKPFLIYLFDMINRFGFDEIILLASHANSVLVNYFTNTHYKNCNIKIIIEDEPLGTGGALVNAYNHLDETFFCINGDSVIDGNWLSIIADFDVSCDAVIGLTKTEYPERFGSIVMDNNNLIKKFNEKNTSIKSELINGGVYLLRKIIFKNLEKCNLSIEKDIFPNLVKNKKLRGKIIPGYFIDIGTPESLDVAKNRNWNQSKKAIIFDRDGTLNKDNGYTYKTSDLEWKAGAMELIKYLNDKNYLVFVATNQSGIARAKYTEDDMNTFHKEMQKQLRKIGAHIDKFYFCPYHVDGVIEKFKKDSICRKPNTGMLKDIKKEWHLTKENMYMIGDKDTDIECASNFNIESFLYNDDDNLIKVLREDFFERD